jgi:hypothetical protein
MAKTAAAWNPAIFGTICRLLHRGGGVGIAARSVGTIDARLKGDFGTSTKVEIAWDLIWIRI